MSTFGAIVGIDSVSSDKQYRLLLANYNKKEDGSVNWQFSCKMLSESQMLNSLAHNAVVINAKLNNEDKKYSVKGRGASLDRFNATGHHPYVIISQIINEDKKILGYKIASYDGKVRNVTLKEIIAYGTRITKQGGVPIQNAIFVPAEADKRPHFKSYPGCNFISEVFINKKNQYTEPKRVNTAKNEKTLNKLEEIYSRDQIKQLKLGKQQGVDIRIYANPALSAQQMAALREGLERKINVRPFAFPEYSVELIKYYTLDLKNGLDVRKYLNSKYSLGQVSELSIAVEEGLDISKMANPKLQPEEMAEIRERLEKNIWKDELVKKDGSWK